MFMAFRLLQRFAALLTVFLSTSVFHQAYAQDKRPDDFQSLARTAAAARDQNNAVEAIHSYQEALRLQPDWQEGLWNLGVLEYEQDHYAKAIPAFQRLTQLAAQAGPAWNFLGLCEYETKAYDNALQHLSKGKELGGVDDPELLRVVKYHLALLLIRDGNFDDALATLRTLISQGPAGVPAQITTALGLATLRVPLLPEQVDASKEALLQEAGNAEAALLQGQTASALTGFEALLHKYPDVPYVHLAYGSALFNAVKCEQAAAQAQKEIELAPRSSTAHDLLAKSLEAAGHREQARNEAALAEKLRSQESAAEERIVERYAIRVGAQSAANFASSPGQRGDALWNQAMASYSGHRYAEAMADLKQWVERTPNSGTAWAVMGLSEFELKDYDNALIHLQRGQQVGLSGNFESVQLARYRLAILLLRRSRFENAETLLMSVAGKGPLAEEVRFALGLSLLRMQMLPEEVESAKKPLVAATGEIAELLKDSKYDEAFPKFEVLIKQYPSVPFLHYVYGTALATLSRYDEAEGQFHHETMLSPASALPYLQLASVKLKRHRAGEALPSAQKATQLAPDSAEAHYVLGRTYLELGNDKLAITELEQAAKIEPESPQIHFNLAKAYAKANVASKAEEQREIFTRLNALAEQQRSLQGNQSYGAHNAADSTFSPADVTKANKPDQHPQ